MKKCVSAAALRATLSAALVCAASVSAFAQSIPSPWLARDVGAPTLSGSATYNSGIFTLDAAGVDIWNTSDQFHFVYQAVAGDVELIARVDSLDDVDPFTNAGVMVRASLNPDSAHGYTASTSANGVYFRRRLSAAATTSSLKATVRDAPVWVRIVRQGSLVTSYWSSDGSTWTAIGSSSISLGTTAYVGLAVSSHNASTRATGVFSNVKLIKPGSVALPSGQNSTDIGGPAGAGSATYSAGAYTVKGAGTIWDTADQFHFVYQPVTGDAEVVARVGSITEVDMWSKAGVMIRESLTPQSTHASMFASAGKGYAFQRRLTTGAYTDNTSGGRGAPPGWVKLVRAGDLFTAYRSTDGLTWTKVGADTLPMVATVYVGLAVASHDRDGAATTAGVDSFKLTAAAAANGSPSVSITSPAAGTQITLPTTVAIAASASDPESRMASVDFYAGSTLIVRDTTAPYSASWTPSGAGTYALTAVAHDADGGSSTSSAVSVTVNTATNKAPTVSLTSPLAGATFATGATVTLSATASDPENQLARVEFYAGSTRLATDTSAPYSFSWTNVAAGTYSLTARAFDAAGASATSAAVNISVAASTTTTTAPKTVAFIASADHATNVTSYVLKIFAATANPATATPVATSDLGKPTPSSTGEITVDRATFFSGLATGTYQAAVAARGSGGETLSGAVSFTR